VYSRLKYESGTHRVQRVPVTESQGRIHTSAVTVAIMPEAEEVDVAIDPGELRIDVYRSSGPGGQSVNTTDSAVRVTQSVRAGGDLQGRKSQHKNRAKALKVLRSRLLQLKQGGAAPEQEANRRSQVGSGDRSERIRTYNFPQSRVTDHRINLTLVPAGHDPGRGHRGDFGGPFGPITRPSLKGQPTPLRACVTASWGMPPAAKGGAAPWENHGWSGRYGKRPTVGTS
jgi:hypothetical protein